MVLIFGYFTIMVALRQKTSLLATSDPHCEVCGWVLPILKQPKISLPQWQIANNPLKCKLDSRAGVNMFLEKYEKALEQRIRWLYVSKTDFHLLIIRLS